MALGKAALFDQEYALKEEIETVSIDIKTGALPLNMADMLGSAVNMLEKVTSVEPPSSVVDEPYCMVGKYCHETTAVSFSFIVVNT